MALRDCTDADEALTTLPCLNCLSIHQLWVVLMGLLANGNGNAGDIDALKATAAEYRGMTEKQWLMAMIAALPDSFWSSLTVDEIGQSFGCATCWSDAEVKAVLLTQWCEFWAGYTPPQ